MITLQNCSLSVSHTTHIFNKTDDLLYKKIKNPYFYLIYTTFTDDLMNDLNHVVSALSNDEQHEFLAFLTKKNKRPDAKNTQLFKLLQDNTLDSKHICKKLYGTTTSQAYYALRKRLFQSIISFTANASLEDESSSQMEVMTYILASRSFLQRKYYTTAYHILDKAEYIAKEYQLFAFLNEIYTIQIQYTYTYPDRSLELLIQKLAANKQKHHLEEQLNIVYAKMRYELTLNQTSNFQTLFTTTLKTYHIDILDQLSFKALYQLISIASISAFATKNYLQIESFLIDTYKIIISNANKDKQPYYHIQILYHIANTLFRNKKFETSQVYLQDMHTLMLKHKKKYYNAFKLKYDLLLSLNYNYTNQQQKAILTITHYAELKHTDTESLLDLNLCLVMFFFQKNELKKAQNLLSKFHHSDKWYIKKAGIEWAIKKHLMEILLYIELEALDLVASRLLSFKRYYFDYLKSIKQERAIVFIDLVKTYFNTPECIQTDTFKSRVRSSFDFVGVAQEDIFVMSFYAWLKAKIQATPLYATTIELLHD
jgi:hypothetical protein